MDGEDGVIRNPFTDNDSKSELSYAYVHAVAAVAGFSCEATRIDRASIDVKIQAHGRVVPDERAFASASIYIQLKATSTVVLSAGASKFSFPLPIKNYNDLRARTQVPHLLVVLLMPKSKKKWLEGDEHGLTTRHCAYWRSLRDEPAVNNSKRRNVLIQLKNRFDPDVLRQMMIMSAREQTIGDDLT